MIIVTQSASILIITYPLVSDVRVYLSYTVGQGNPLDNHILHVIEGHHYIILKHLSVANNFAMLQNVT